MGFFKGPEIIKKMIKTGIATVQLPSGSNLLIGGQGYKLTTSLTCDTAVSGVGGLDTGSIAASNFYYVYTVISANVIYLVASLSNESPTGFSAYKKVGSFQVDHNGDILNAYFFGDSIDTDLELFTPTGSWVSGNETYTGNWRRNSDKVEYQITIDISGAVTATTLIVDLEHVMATSKMLNVQTQRSMGDVSVRDTSASVPSDMITGYVVRSTDTAVFAKVSNATATYEGNSYITNALPVTFGVGDVITMSFSFPVAGWSKEIDWNNY